MAHRVCPWWLGHVLASPLRRLAYNPSQILASYVHDGMTVLEPGPGMGFFTIELARRVGKSGRVVAVEIQPRMIAGLKRRIAKAGLLGRVEARLPQRSSIGVVDLAGTVDFTLAFAVVHEMPRAVSSPRWQQRRSPARHCCSRNPGAMLPTLTSRMSCRPPCRRASWWRIDRRFPVAT